MSNRNLHADHSQARDDDCPGCGYCDLEFGRMHHEHDHMPVPKGAGGVDMIPACVTCHDLKDRSSFGNWPPKMFADAVRELLALGLMTPTPATVVPDEWETMSRGARLVWAKMVRRAHEAPDRIPAF